MRAARGRLSVCAGRPEQVAAERRMTDGLVADHVDQRGLARFESAIERRDYLVGVRDVLAMASHLRENLVVANILEHVEWVGAVLQQRHRLEARAPRAVVPQQEKNRQLVAPRRLPLPPP